MTSRERVFMTLDHKTPDRVPMQVECVPQLLEKLNPGHKIAYHSCGNVEPVSGDFIDIGLVILNPIQPKAMSPAKLKNKYGQDLVFLGGIDIQEVLSFGDKIDILRRSKAKSKSWAEAEDTMSPRLIGSRMMCV